MFFPKFDNYALMASLLFKNCAILVKIIGKTKSVISREEILIEPSLFCKVKLKGGSF